MLAAIRAEAKSTWAFKEKWRKKKYSSITKQKVKTIIWAPKHLLRFFYTTKAFRVWVERMINDYQIISIVRAFNKEIIWPAPFSLPVQCGQSYVDGISGERKKPRESERRRKKQLLDTRNEDTSGVMVDGSRHGKKKRRVSGLRKKFGNFFLGFTPSPHTTR